MNPKKKDTCRIRIDGSLIRENVMKCDYGLWVDDGKMILIELKGSDVVHALEQLSNTHRILLENYKGWQFRYWYRIVSAKVSKPNLISRTKTMRKLQGIDVKIKSRRLVEEI